MLLPRDLQFHLPGTQSIHKSVARIKHIQTLSNHLVREFDGQCHGSEAKQLRLFENLGWQKVEFVGITFPNDCIPNACRISK